MYPLVSLLLTSLSSTCTYPFSLCTTLLFFSMYHLLYQSYYTMSIYSLYILFIFFNIFYVLFIFIFFVYFFIGSCPCYPYVTDTWQFSRHRLVAGTNHRFGKHCFSGRQIKIGLFRHTTQLPLHSLSAFFQKIFAFSFQDVVNAGDQAFHALLFCRQHFPLHL